MTINKWHIVDDPSSKWAKRIRADISADSKKDVIDVMDDYKYAFGTIFDSKSKNFSYSFFIYEGRDPGGEEVKKILAGEKPSKTDKLKEEPAADNVNEKTLDDLNKKAGEPPSVKEDNIKIERFEEAVHDEDEEELTEPSEEPAVKPSGKTSPPQQSDPDQKAETKEEEKKNFQIDGQTGAEDIPPKEAIAPAVEDASPEPSEEPTVKPDGKTQAEHSDPGQKHHQAIPASLPHPDRKVDRIIKLGVIYSAMAEDIKISAEQKPTKEAPTTEKIYDIFIEKLNGIVAKQNINVDFELSYRMGYEGVPDREKVTEKQKEADVLVILDAQSDLEKLENVFKQEDIVVYSMPLKDIKKDYEYLNLAADMALRV
ncbi:MAG: hypothetical protein PF545_04525 [Elusimicrobia bacterium]|jgi:hypothetical protein|nr:hypothetical protein [Elusimicrobiota bacterium]